MKVTFPPWTRCPGLSAGDLTKFKKFYNRKKQSLRLGACTDVATKLQHLAAWQVGVDGEVIITPPCIFHH